MVTSEHKFTIPNVTNETSGVCIINLPFSISESSAINVDHGHKNLRVIAKMSSYKTIKLIWFSDLVKPVYEIKLIIER